MDDWLSEIEENIAEATEVAREKLIPKEYITPFVSLREFERMARVLREQSAVLSKTTPWTVQAKVPNGYRCIYCQAGFVDEEVIMLPAPNDFLDKHRTDCVWRSLSDDAKELACL